MKATRSQLVRLVSLVIKLPMPPGTLPTLWQNDERFLKSYLSSFEGYYATGDAGYIDEDGYIFASRTDDIINVAAQFLPTGAMEEVLQGPGMLPNVQLLACMTR